MAGAKTLAAEVLGSTPLCEATDSLTLLLRSKKFIPSPSICPDLWLLCPIESGGSDIGSVWQHTLKKDWKHPLWYHEALSCFVRRPVTILEVPYGEAPRPLVERPTAHFSNYLHQGPRHVRTYILYNPAQPGISKVLPNDPSLYNMDQKNHLAESCAYSLSTKW